LLLGILMGQPSSRVSWECPVPSNNGSNIFSREWPLTSESFARGLTHQTLLQYLWTIQKSIFKSKKQLIVIKTIRGWFNYTLPIHTTYSLSQSRETVPLMDTLVYLKPSNRGYRCAARRTRTVAPAPPLSSGQTKSFYVGTDTHLGFDSKQNIVASVMREFVVILCCVN
jgi:hypothetical protein